MIKKWQRTREMHMLSNNASKILRKLTNNTSTSNSVLVFRGIHYQSIQPMQRVSSAAYPQGPQVSSLPQPYPYHQVSPQPPDTGHWNSYIFRKGELNFKTSVFVQKGPTQLVASGQSPQEKFCCGKWWWLVTDLLSSPRLSLQNGLSCLIVLVSHGAGERGQPLSVSYTQLNVRVRNQQLNDDAMLVADGHMDRCSSFCILQR